VLTFRYTEVNSCGDAGRILIRPPNDSPCETQVATGMTTHPDNFGGTILALRQAGDHTPAAVIKGKNVPGYYKKHPVTTTTQTTATTP
jgi:hypothetical protein